MELDRNDVMGRGLLRIGRSSSFHTFFQWSGQRPDFSSSERQKWFRLRRKFGSYGTRQECCDLMERVTFNSFNTFKDWEESSFYTSSQGLNSDMNLIFSSSERQTERAVPPINELPQKSYYFPIEDVGHLQNILKTTISNRFSDSSVSS